MTKVVPRSGMIIIDPETNKVVPPGGLEVAELSSYWVRRIQDGDIFESPNGNEGK